MNFKPPPISSLPISDIIHGVHALGTAIFLVCGVLYFGFSSFYPESLATVGAIVVTWFVGYGITKCLYKFRRIDAGANDEELLKKCRTNILIGTGVGLIAAWIPRIMVFIYDLLWPIEDEAYWYTFFVCLPIIPLYWALFILKSKLQCEVTYSRTDKRTWIVLAINFFVMLVTVKIATSYAYYNDFTGKLWTQLLLSAICTACSMEFVQVWNGNIRLIYPETVAQVSGNVPILNNLGGGFWNPLIMENGGQTEKLAVPGPQPMVADRESETRLQCKNCREDYSNSSKTPRMLKECGHTICEKCADKLLNNGQHLFCPFCQKVTVVNGKANLLPKNITVIEMMEEMKNIYRI